MTRSDLSNGELWKGMPPWMRVAIIAPTTAIALFLVYTLASGLPLQDAKLDSLDKTLNTHAAETRLLLMQINENQIRSLTQINENQIRIADALEKLTCALLASSDEQRRRCAEMR